MELSLSSTLLAGDPRLIDHIVGEVKSQGIFDQFRKECIADVDTKPAYQNLRTRVEGSVNSFLTKQIWKPDLNKNQLRETLRKHIHDAPYLDAGVERIVDQVVNPKVYSVFMSQIEDVVYKFLGIERPKVKEKNGACGLKDLLPKDLDPVSPESDKNSLKDVSLESIDACDVNDVDEKQVDKANEQKLQDEEIYRDKNKASPENGHISAEEKMLDETCKALNKTGSSLNLNTSGKSDDKMEDEDEEVSPTFEPIDIMNLNESNISNDSHLSGISELTSHRSRSPDFSNELSRDNFDCSNQDSQLSKVSSDSRLSIVTDFGSSNHGLTPVHDALKDDVTKDKYDIKSSKDNFKAIREFDSSKSKIAKSNFDFAKNKDGQDYKDLKDFKSTKSISSKENSRDGTDSGMKDKYDKSSKEKSKDSESIKSKNTKEKISNKDAKYYKDRSNERKKSRSHSSEKYDKHSKSKSKDKIDQVKENSDKAKDISETFKDNVNKLKDEKFKEVDKKDKDNINKEAKDLKDIYKEKIRELREKKELTEKEKLNKDKDVKLIKEAKDKKDSLKEKKSNRKEHKSSSSSSSKNIPVNYHESRSSKMSEKVVDGKDKRSESKDKAKRDEKRLSRDNKGKNHYSSKTDLSDKPDPKKVEKSKSEKEDKSGKVDVRKDGKASGDRTTNGKKDAKIYLQQNKSSDRSEKSDGKRDSKNDSPSKDKKRREDKKSKTKDDHSSLRKSSNDRRSTDRDGSNGSNSKTSPSNNANSNMTSNKSGTSSLTKENNHVSNSGSETSDSIEETQMNDSQQPNYKSSHKINLSNDKNYLKLELDNVDETYDKHEEEAVLHDTSLPLKKRLLSSKEDESTSDDVKIRKPKFAKNIHEAKKLMKIRKLMEKEKLKEDKKGEKKVTYEAEQMIQSSTTKDADNLEGMPDDERVQIIEIPDEEYEEPYPEKQETHLTLDERSIIMLGTESCTNDFLNRQSKSTLSNMELCIKQSLSEIVSDAPLEEAITQNSKTDEKITQSDDPHVEDTEAFKEKHNNITKETNNKTLNIDAEKCSLQIEKTHVSQKQIEITSVIASVSVKSESVDNNEKTTEKLMEKHAEERNYNETETRNDNEAQIDNRTEIGDNNEEIQDEKQIEMCASSKIDKVALHSDCLETRSSSSVISEDNGEDCYYFKTDNKKSERFSSFLESLELLENSSLEDIIESLGGKVVFSIPKSMAAPPLPKSRKRSSSPLSDILVNNSDNNNDHKRTLSLNEDTVHNVKKRRFNKKPRFSNLCNLQGMSNGENFVMPLSPDSDVSATSEKTASSNVIKEEKSRNRSSQRYSSDDLYKPRPLFSSSSRRSRRSNQA